MGFFDFARDVVRTAATAVRTFFSSGGDNDSDDDDEKEHGIGSVAVWDYEAESAEAEGLSWELEDESSEAENDEIDYEAYDAEDELFEIEADLWEEESASWQEEEDAEDTAEDTAEEEPENSAEWEAARAEIYSLLGQLYTVDPDTAEAVANAADNATSLDELIEIGLWAYTVAEGNTPEKRDMAYDEAMELLPLLRPSDRDTIREMMKSADATEMQEIIELIFSLAREAHGDDAQLGMYMIALPQDSEEKAKLLSGGGLKERARFRNATDARNWARGLGGGGFYFSYETLPSGDVVVYEEVGSNEQEEEED